MKVKNQKETRRNEFRKNKITQHPAYIFAKVGKNFKFLGLTHSDTTKGVKNIKLDKNPNPKDKKQAYIKPIKEKEMINKFNKKESDWKLSKSDKEKIKKLIK